MLVAELWRIVYCEVDCEVANEGLCGNWAGRNIRLERQWNGEPPVQEAQCNQCPYREEVSYRRMRCYYDYNLEWGWGWTYKLLLMSCFESCKVSRKWEDLAGDDVVAKAWRRVWLVGNFSRASVCPLCPLNHLIAENIAYIIKFHQLIRCCFAQTTKTCPPSHHLSVT